MIFELLNYWPSPLQAKSRSFNGVTEMIFPRFTICVSEFAKVVYCPCPFSAWLIERSVQSLHPVVMEHIEKGTSGRHADSANGSNKAVNLHHSSILREYASVYKVPLLSPLMRVLSLSTELKLAALYSKKVQLSVPYHRIGTAHGTSHNISYYHELR